jgi:hypothetical protein
VKHIDVEIEGVTPLLMNKFTDKAAMAATEGAGARATGERGTPLEQATEVLYTDEEGRCVVPQPNIFRSIIDGGIFFKVGRSKITTQKSSLIPAALTIDLLVIPVIHKEPWTVDTRPVRIPATGGRILKHRPCFNDWKLKFPMTLDEGEISEKLMREIVDAAGRKIGVCDFRPQTKGAFGRYVVTSWKSKKV